MFKLNLKIALRNLWKNKAFTLINVGGLSLGLASCMLLLLYVSYEWGYDKQFKDYDKTYVVYNNMAANGDISSYPWTPTVMSAEVREKITGVAHAAHSTYPGQSLISYKQKSLKKSAIYAEPDLLKILDYKFISGNPASALQGINTVILTKTLAKTLFGDEDPINKMVKLRNTEALKVEAVIEDIPANSTIKFDLMMPWKLNEKVFPYFKTTNWQNNVCLTLVQLKDNRLFDAANSQMTGIYKRNRNNSTSEALLHPLSKWHLYDKFEHGKSIGGKIEQLRIFIILAFSILLIAAVNFMNLSTARSEKRAKEVGIRKAIGSSRKTLISQFMIESMLLAFIGMVIAFTLIEICLPYFNSLLNSNILINYGDWLFWVILVGLTMFTGAIAGSYPAFYLSSFEPVKVLKGFHTSGGSSVQVRKALVVFQFVFAAALIVCTTVIYQQLNYIKNKPAGFEKGGLVEIPIQGNLVGEQHLKLLKEQLLKSGAASDVAFFSTTLDQYGNNTSDFSWSGKNPKEASLVNFRTTGHDLVKTIGGKMLSGRDFSPQFSDSLSAILNESAVKLMGLKNPVGSVIKYGETPLTVIGVMKDFIMESPYQSVNPMVLLYSVEETSSVIIRLNPQQNLSNAITQIDGIVKEMNPDFPVDRTFVDDNFEQKFQNEKLLGTLANWFGGFAIFISCLGLLGLTLFMAEQRKKEIGIRKVLGANNLNILVLLNKDFIRLVAIANLIAFPIAYVAIDHWLSGFSFRVAISILPFLIATGLSLLIAVLTLSMQSVKVAKSNPIDALKYE